VKLNHPPQQLLGTVDEGRRLRNRVIQHTSEVANQVSYSCYLAKQSPRKLMKHFKMKAGCLPCMKSSINSPEMMFGPWFIVLQNRKSLVPSGFSRRKQMSMVLWSEIKPVLLPRVILEEVDFDETFAPFARLESIRILLSIACHLGFKLYQMDVNSAFCCANFNTCKCTNPLQYSVLQVQGRSHMKLCCKN
jgi:hypothetical protein